MSKRTYRADLSAMHPLHPAWGLWLTDLLGLNISLVAGRVLMTSRSYRDFRVNGRNSAVLWHEEVHRRQKQEDGYLLFFLRYVFSRSRRAGYERHAYEVTTAWMVKKGIKQYGGGRGHIIWLAGIMSGWRYGWMMGKGEAFKWAESMTLGILESQEDYELFLIDEIQVFMAWFTKGVRSEQSPESDAGRIAFAGYSRGGEALGMHVLEYGHPSSGWLEGVSGKGLTSRSDTPEQREEREDFFRGTRVRASVWKAASNG